MYKLRKIGIPFVCCILGLMGCFFVISLQPIMQPIIFQDQACDSTCIDVYSSKSLTLVTIEGIEVHGGRVRIKANEPYKGLAFESYYGEVVDLDMERFSTDILGASFTLNYNSTKHIYYLERTFEYLFGMNTISILFSFLALLLICYLLSMMAELVFPEKTKESIYKTSGLQKNRNALSSIALSFILIVTLLFVLISNVNDIFYFLQEQNDQIIMLGGLFVVVGLVVVCTLFQWLRKGVVVNIRHKEIKVWKGNNLLFQGAIDQVNFIVLIVRNHGRDSFFRPYSSLDVELSSHVDKSKSVHLGLVSWGFDEFERFTNYLSVHQNKTQPNQSIHKNNKDTTNIICMRNVSKLRKIILFELLVVALACYAFAVVLEGSIFLYLNIVIVLFAIVTPFIGLYKSSLWFQSVTIKATKSYLQINNTTIDVEDIVFVKLRPVVTNFQLFPIIQIKTMQKNYQYQVEKDNYELLENIIKDNYKDKVRVT